MYTKKNHAVFFALKNIHRTSQNKRKFHEKFKLQTQIRFYLLFKQTFFA